MRPRAKEEVIVETGVVGVAIKKSDIGRDVPGVDPVAQVVPEELVCTAGTKTFQLPAESTYRKGLSLVTGLVARVVYGGLGKDCGGALMTPEKT